MDTLKTKGIIQYHKLQDALHRKNTVLDDRQKTLLAEVLQKGFATVPDYYSAEECAALREEVDRQIVSFKDNDKIRVNGNEADTRLFGIEKHSKSIRKFHEDPFLKGIMEGYYQATGINLCTMANRIQAQEGNLGSGAGWHRDSVHIRQFKSIIYLSEVTEESGPFQYLEGSQTPKSMYELLRAGLLSFGQNRLNEEEVEKIISHGFPLHTFTATAGTLILTDTRGIHRGMPLKTGKRYALTNYYFAKHQLKDKWKAKFEALFV